MALWSSLSTYGIHFAQTFRFPRLLVRTLKVFAGEFPTAVAIIVRGTLRLRSRTEFTFEYGLHPSPILELLLEGHRLSFPAILIAFTHRQIVSYEEACVPTTSLKDL
jgi:hypothetical protein